MISGKGLGNTDLVTALTAIPGVAIGLGVVYALGLRAEQQRRGSAFPRTFPVRFSGGPRFAASLS